MKFEYNTYVYRINRKKRVAVQDHTYNCNSLFYYLIYLLRLIIEHKLYFPYKANLLDYDLIAQYNLSTQTYWKRMIKVLKECNIIMPIKRANYSKKEATTYIINIDNLLDLFWKVYDKEIYFYEDTYSILLKHVLYPIINPSYPINNNNVQNMLVTSYNIEYLLRERLYESIDYNSEVGLKIYRELTYLNNRGYTITCRPREERGRYRGRQCFYPTFNMKTEDRNIWLEERGLTDEFDLHSAIFSVARLINKGEFDADWSIKDIFAKNNYYYTDGTVLERDDFKKDDHLMYMLFFADYKTYHKQKRIQTLNREMFERIYRDANEICGDLNRFSNCIFLYESLLELRVMHELHDRGCDFANAYDCFFFNPNQISKDEVKQIINKVANKMANEFKGE